MKTPTSFETRALDLGSELFQDAIYADEILDQYYRGFLSEEGLAERIKFLRNEARLQASRRVFGPAEPDDVSARPGTWDESDPWEAA